MSASVSVTSPPVVLDTNVLVAAGFNPRSASARIVDAVKRARARMVWNDATRRETERIVQQIPPLRRRPVTELFRPENQVLTPTHPEHFAEIPDPDDRKFAALARAAGAVLISNDKHLLESRDQLDFAVLTPAEFWQSQGSETSRDG